MSIGTTKMTSRQFLELGEDPEHRRLELVDGEVVLSPSPNPDHSFIDTRLRIIIGSYVEANDLGELFGDVDTIFGEHDVRRPDLIFFAKDRLHLVGRSAMHGPPDLCIEIISPSGSKTDRKVKFKLYEAGGVAHYWIVDPAAKTLEGYQLQSGKYRLTGQGRESDLLRLPPFPDLEIPLKRLWWRKR